MVSLDHALIFVRDLDRAAPAFQRLGFTLTPRGSHPTLGTANHTIMFERDYLELLTVVTRGPANEGWARLLDRGDGFGAMALATANAEATAETLRSREIAVPPVIHFERPVALPSGVVAARFTVARVPSDASPALPAFFCQHHTPEHVWRPEYQRHPNTAFGLVGLTVMHPDPESVAPAYERLSGRATVHPHPGGLSVQLRGARLWLVRPAYAEGRLARSLETPPDGIRPLGLTVAVRDPLAARQILTANGVPFAPFGRRSILIGPTWTHDVYLELLAA